MNRQTAPEGELLKTYKPKTFGAVTLSFTGNRWRLRYLDSNGDDKRRVVPAATVEQAEAAAITASAAILAGRNYTPTTRPVRVTGKLINVALEDSIRRTAGNDATLTRYRTDINRFLAFLRETEPDVMYWNELRPSHFTDYVRSLQNDGLAYDTIRLALVPVKRAAQFWAAEVPDLYRDFATAARVKLQRPLPQPIPALTPAQLDSLFSWLHENVPALWPIAVLQGAAGLRLLEAAALRACDVDLARSTVTVAQTATHTPKNRSSYRTIPLHPLVVDALREYLQAAPIRDMDPTAPLFLNERGNPYTLDALSTAWQRALNGSQRGKPRRKTTRPAKTRPGCRTVLDLPAEFSPHHLRASFATACRRGRCDSRALQALLGHAGQNVLEAHYESIDTDYLRAEVIAAFDTVWQARNEQKHGDSWQHSGNAYTTEPATATISAL